MEAAAQRYFHKPASRLNMSEAALLAAVLPNP
ncbi:transglycosylase domain-containing protein, partial [Salmonella enterica subsp. enterica serovar Kentucky]|nr:transglycosylase domain-containing protein [Salmonella enterica subsp. enterica serovar Kentucky]